MRIFKSQLYKKLIFSFIIVGILPMIITLLVATKIISRQLEEDIKNRLYSASTIVDSSIQDIQGKALMTAKYLLNQPEFITAFKREDYERMESIIRFVKSEIIPIDIILPQPIIIDEVEQTVMHFEMQQVESLLAGVIVPIADRRGKNIGRLVVGNFLADRFAQAMSRATGVEVRVLMEVSPDSELVSLEEKLVRDIQIPKRVKQEVFEKGRPYYDTTGTKIKGQPYAAFYKPFLSKEGGVLGFVFLGIPKIYAFPIVMRQFLPILISISILLAVAIGYVIARGISKPITRFIKGAEEIASGNLDQHIKLQSRDEIGKLAVAFNNMAGELKKVHQMELELRRLDKLSALGQLAAGVAHEVRNPLGIIKNSAQILQESSLEKERKLEILNFIVEETERINKVIDNFLQFARPPQAQKEKTDINGAIDRTIRLLNDTLIKNRIYVEREYADSLPSIYADTSQLQQLFLNVVLNSIEAMPNGGKLKISTRSENKGVKVSIADTGRGIPEDLKEKIFEPFYTTKENGTGLGLAIAKKIVENHEGRIGVESEAKGGSLFNIWLPVE